MRSVAIEAMGDVVVFFYLNPFKTIHEFSITNKNDKMRIWSYFLPS